MFKDFNIDKFKSIKPPSDNSFTTMQEVKQLSNIPLNKTYNKVQNIRQSLNKEHSALERVMMFFGWSQYNLDLENEKMKKIKEETKKKKKKKKKKEPYFLDI